MLGAGGASKVLPLLRALARDATSCVVLLDADEEGAKEFGMVCASGLINAADVFRRRCVQDVQKLSLRIFLRLHCYVDSVSEAIGMDLDSVTFANERKASGSSRTRMQKWSNVMERICNANGKNWDLVSDKAKSAFGRSIRDKVAGIPVTKLKWASSIARQVNRHLAEV